MKDCLKEYDAVMAPASDNPAPYLDDNSADELSANYLIVENYMAMGNFSGYPSMTVPIGFADDLPLGLNMTCRPFEETTMFDFGKAIEEITGSKDMKAEVE